MATRDWHPADHHSFEEQGGPWPPHCVQGTPGAELNPRFDHSRIDHIVDVGAEPSHEGYSGFEHSDLEAFLREHDVEDVTVVGLATDYCVRASALDALARGFKVTVDPAGVRGDRRQARRLRAGAARDRRGGRPDRLVYGQLARLTDAPAWERMLASMRSFFRRFPTPRTVGAR